MPDNTNTCTEPGKLKGSPEDCSPEQIRQCHGTQQDHACIIEEERKILAEIKESHGFLPDPPVVMSKRTGVLSRFMAYNKRVFEGGPLSDRERFLIALAAAAALKSPVCVRSNSQKAIKAGATQDEVFQTVLIGAMIANTSSLHAAHGLLVAAQEADPEA
jgi:AhpD family alkylhydroperoxidase